jgi:hypothetical protein
MPQTKLPEIMDHYMKPYDTRSLTIHTRELILSINQYPILEPLADYVFGVARVFQRVGGGNVTYFLGEVSTQGFLSYFPIIFLIKEPLPIIFLVLFSLIVSAFVILRSIVEEPEKVFHNFIFYLRTRVIEFTMLAFIALYSFTSIIGRLNIGLRHLFPIFPFMYILISVQLFRFIRKRRLSGKYTSYAIIFILLINLVFGTVIAYPSYMSYFNSIAGGPENGYRFATDSNADWGQDLKRLKIFLTDHPEIGKVKIDYFGMADLDHYIGGRYEKWWAAKRPIEPGWYAISALFLQEGIYDRRKTDDQSYRWLKGKEPVYQIGTSILIYRISQDEIK